MHLSEIKLDELYRTKEALTFVHQDAVTPAKVFPAGTVVKVFGKNDQTFARYCTSVFVSAGRDYQWDALIGAHLLAETKEEIGL